MKAEFDPKAVIIAALKGASSANPAKLETILASAKTAAQQDAVKNTLSEMISTGEIMHCTVTQMGKKQSQKGKVIETYWPTGVPAKLPYSHGRIGGNNGGGERHVIASARISL